MMAMGFSEDDWRQYRWAYNRLVELVDQQIGRLLSTLKENGLDRNTVIIFTSDHGDGYGAHRWHQKSVLYEESCRVPFIISWPGKARKNETDDRLISVGIDLMATISDIVGAEMPPGPYYGISALPFVFDANSPAPTHEYVVTEAEVSEGSKVAYAGRAVRTPKFKYHVWNKGEKREQLFDMVQDPGETRNVAGNPEYARTTRKTSRAICRLAEKNRRHLRRQLESLMAHGLLGRGCWRAGYTGRRCALPRTALWLLLRSGEAMRQGADECKHQAMLVLKGNAGTASLPRPACPFRITHSRNRTNRPHSMANGKKAIDSFEIAHPRFIFNTHANAECGMRNRRRPHVRFRRLRPKGAKQISPGQSEVASAAERRPGFRSSR